ncbi:hypothetical protein MXB_3612 [Myxobolus squamalis]|nr:hypothetical protein MXB_3612 [Myxobolus squamalis]
MGVVHQPVADDTSQYIKEFIGAQALNLSKYPDDITLCTRKSYMGERFNRDFPRIITWASDEELSILRQQGQVHIDGTLRCAVITVVDVSSNLTIPCVWCLTTGKNEHIYCEILHSIFIL